MFKNRMKELREARKLTQQDVAEALQIPETTYQGYESGKRGIKQNMLFLIADFFDVTIDDLLMRKTPERYILISGEENHLLTRYRTLDEHDRRLIRALLDEAYHMRHPSPLICQNHTAVMASRSQEDIPVTETELSPEDFVSSGSLIKIPDDI